MFKMRSKNDVSEWLCLRARWEVTHSTGPNGLCLSSSVGTQLKLNCCYAYRFQCSGRFGACGANPVSTTNTEERRKWAVGGVIGDFRCKSQAGSLKERSRVLPHPSA